MSVIPQGTPGHPVWLHVGTLLDGSNAAPARDAHIVYDAAGIRFVGGNGQTPPAELLREGQTAPDVVAPDATLLPGLIDAHTHLFLEGGELDLDKRAAYLKQSPAELLASAMPRLEKLVRLGVAGVRDAGDKDGVGLALSRLCKSRAGPVSDRTLGQSETGPTLMPYLDSPGAAIHRRGRYGSFMGGALEEFASPADCVAARIAGGADRIKLIPTGIINFQKGAVTAEPQMTTAELREFAAAANGAGRQTLAHASGDAGIERVVEGGVDSVEHGFFMRDDQLERMRDRRIAWVPTFAPVQVQVDEAARYNWDASVTGNLQRILDAHAASLVKAHARGVIILAGSDAGSCGVAHGLGLLYELELMERAGLPAAAVIHAATGAAADRLAFGQKFGRIAPGWRSRFILTRHSPLETVRNMRRARTVVFDGRVFSTGEQFDGAGL
ncbi:amidohydrolase family protein [Oleiharenicola lentus]|uniref:amidohydrolase family protein n=1 Tax=Oleiharenicola lentus TaxID=2508720 RepID=UPI0013E993A3|nr:amidohydrolase family protein [Oleiharenicola lentus]